MKILRKVILLILLAGCSGLEQSEQESLRRNNAKGEFVLRNSSDKQFTIDTPAHRIRKRYPWEHAYSGAHPKITKEFFRCKGNALNPPHPDHRDPGRLANYFDCGGSQKHSLPLQSDREFIYPILIDLLNHIQEKTQCKIIITCGHRCPVHNAYVDSAPSNQHSKHLIGAEVDFYVQGMENNPQDVIHLLMQHYTDTFQRLEKTELSTLPWYNKEILIKLYKKNEGRDWDNRHPYPYICLQVRYDTALNEKVTCSLQKAFNSYKRY